MEDDGWSFGFSVASRGYHQSTLKSQSDFCIDIEDFDGDDDLSGDFPCPFCSEDFDLVGLCYHIYEEHTSEARSGECPVCATRVVVDMVGHITTQHGSFFKGQHRLKLHKGEYSTLSLSRKELQDAHFQSLFGGSPPAVSTSKMALDPLLSFLYNSPFSEKSDSVQADYTAEVNLEDKSSGQPVLESSQPQPPPLSDKDQEEKAERCKFVQGLLLSTIFDD